MKKISLITVAYNCASTIENTFKSVINQTAKEHTEYIVIDGNSNDGTFEVIKKYSSHIDHVISEPDKGIYDAMNKGIALANGEWIGFLHADDEFAKPTTLETIIAETSNANIIYGDLQYISKHTPPKIIRYWQSENFKTSLLKKGWMPPHPTLYIKKSLFDWIGNFNTNYKISADYDFILRLFSSRNISPKYLNEVFVNMRIGGASNKSLKNIFTKSYEDLKALQINNVGGLHSLFIKNTSKLTQFFKHRS